jgi:uncharacterized phage protein gp47/JayE
MLFSRDVKSYISESEANFKAMVLNGAPHDPITLELARMQAMERGLLEGEVEAMARRLIDGQGESCEAIEARGALLGIPRRAAGKSRGIAIVNGINGTSIPSNLSLNVNGKTFVIDVDGDYNPTQIGITGSERVSIIASEAGAGGNVNGQGYLDTNIQNIQSLIQTVYANGGVNEEDCKTEYLNRVLYGESLDSPVGSAPWYALRALRYPSVTNACVSSCQCCVGELDVYVFAAGFLNNIPDDRFLTNVQNKVFDIDYGSTQYGSKLFGAKITVKAAKLSPINIFVKGAGSLNSSSRNMVATEIREYLASLCVGGTYCKSDITSIIKSVGGCVGLVAYSFNSADYEENEGYISAQCDVMPYLGEIQYDC